MPSARPHASAHGSRLCPSLKGVGSRLIKGETCTASGCGDELPVPGSRCHVLARDKEEPLQVSSALKGGVMFSCSCVIRQHVPLLDPIFLVDQCTSPEHHLKCPWSRLFPSEAISRESNLRWQATFTRRVHWGSAWSVAGYSMTIPSCY